MRRVKVTNTIDVLIYGDKIKIVGYNFGSETMEIVELVGQEIKELVRIIEREGE